MESPYVVSYNGDHSRPRFFLGGLEFGDEVFPFNIQIFVFPGNGDLMRFKIGAIFADLRNVHAEATAHGFGNGEFDLLLRLPGRSPVTLDHFMAVLDLDERATFIVAGTPKRHELLSRLNLPIG